MPEWKDMFTPSAGPSDDFESRVFAKIRRKKVQRKIGAGIAAATAAALLLVMFQPFRSADRQGPLTAGKKAEIPVSENMYFSTSDSRTRYSLQPVSQNRPSAAPAATLNQI